MPRMNPLVERRHEPAVLGCVTRGKRTRGKPQFPRYLTGESYAYATVQELRQLEWSRGGTGHQSSHPATQFLCLVAQTRTQELCHPLVALCQLHAGCGELAVREQGLVRGLPT